MCFFSLRRSHNDPFTDTSQSAQTALHGLRHIRDHFLWVGFLKKNISINIISIFHFQDNYNLWFCLDEEEILSTIYFVSHEWEAKWMGVIYIFNSFVSVDCSLSSATLPVDVNWSKFPETSPQFSGFSSVLFILSRCLTELYSKLNVSESKHFST